MEKKHVNWGCIWLVIGLVVVPMILLLLLAFGIALLVLASDWNEHLRGGVDEFPRLASVWSYGEGDVQVVRIPVSGLIIDEDYTDSFFPRPNPAERVLRQIRAATADPDILAIILEVDSPGGSVTASDEIYRALLDFKEADTRRVVVALFGDVAASGGYYVSCAADYIIAQPTTITGSIGVLISSLNFRQLGQKVGVEGITIKSGRHKDILNPLEDVTPEQRGLLQGVVDAMQKRFLSLVKEGRDLSDEDVARIADGRILTAEEAVACRLVDQTGYWDDAVAQTARMLGVGDVKVMRYHEAFSFSELLSALQRPGLSLEGLLQPPHARLQYLWRVP